MLASTYPSAFDQRTVRFYPYLLGSPIHVGVSYDDILQEQDVRILTRAPRIARLSVPYEVAYRFFLSLVSSCYNHFSLAYNMRAL